MIRLTENEILGVVQKLGINYTDHGEYIKFRCINPTHNDSNPSMTMIKSNGYTRCWSCGLTHNFASFIRAVSNKSIKDFVDVNKFDREFVSSLSQKEIIKKFEKNAERELRILDGKLLDIPRNSKIMDYLKSIHIFEPAIDHFNIQYVQQAEISFKPTDKGTFIQDRIIIPIEENATLVNLECRDYTGEQSKKVIYPRGSKADVLWNYDNLNFKEPLIVVEGIKSALRIWQFISKNVTATLGSGLGKIQKEMISRMKHLILFPDHDKAGISMINQVDKIMEYDYLICMMEREDDDPADGTLDEVIKALKNPIQNQDYWLENHGIEIKPKKIKGWIK